MAYDEVLAARVRAAVSDRAEADEKKMFGGLAFMVNTHMACGIVGDDLMVRVGAQAMAGALAEPHVRPMDFTGRPLKGFVYVSPAGYAGPALGRWVRRAVAYAATVPAARKRTPRRQAVR